MVSPIRRVAASPSLPLVDNLCYSFPETRIRWGPSHRTKFRVTYSFAGPGAFSIQVSWDKGRKRSPNSSADPLEPLKLSYRCVVSNVENARPPVLCGQMKSRNRIVSVDGVHDTFTISLNPGFAGKQFLQRNTTSRT